MAFSIEAALDQHVAALEEPREPDGMWHPSGLFGCARKAVYDFLGAEKAEPDARSKRVFRIGHIFHEFIQDALDASPELEMGFPEVKIVDPERKLKGHADYLAKLRDGPWVVIELKSIKSTGMKYGDLPKDDHRKQVASYVSVLRRYGGLWKITPENEAKAVAIHLEKGWPAHVENGEQYLVIPPIPDLEDVQFLYLSKDDLQPAEFSQKHTEQKEQWITEYLARLQRHVDEGTLPRRLERLTPTGRPSKQRHYLCGYCPFAQRCWEQDEDGVD